MKVHYEDNLFFLMTLVKALKTGLTQDLDAEYFIDKIIEDIFFIDSTLTKTFHSLKTSNSSHQKERIPSGTSSNEKSLYRIPRRTCDGKLAFSPNLEPFFPKLSATLNEHIKDNAEIHLLLDDPDFFGEAIEEDLISQAEYQFLLEEAETPPDKQD